MSSLTLYIQHDYGKKSPFPVKIEPNKTFGELRKKVADILDIDHENLLLCAKEEYNDTFNNKKIKEIDGIDDNLTLYAEGYVCGGGGIPMSDISNKEGLVAKNYSKSAKRWHIITEGLNVTGICKTKECEAYDKQVDCQIGLGTFDLVRDADQVRCPMCLNEIDPLTCCFCECEYKIEGKKKVNGKTERVNTDWKRVEKDYEYYDPDKSGIVKWLMLIIETRSIRD